LTGSRTESKTGAGAATFMIVVLPFAGPGRSSTDQKTALALSYTFFFALFPLPLSLKIRNLIHFSSFVY
jgi:hypothetical protein